MKLDWRQGILYVATIGTEGCWLYALLVLLNEQVADGRLSLFGLLLLYPLSFGFNLLLRRLWSRKVSVLIVSWLAWAVAMLLTLKFQLFGNLAFADTAWLLATPKAIAGLIHGFKPELLVLLSSAALWWLGRRLAYLRISFATSVGEFQFGLVILVITIFVASQLKVEQANSVPIALAFFLFALLGMSLAHAREGKSWLEGLHRGRWAGLLLASIGLIVVLGLLISSAVTPDFLQLILDALKRFWALIMKAIAFLASLLPEPGPAEPVPPISVPAPGTSESEGFRWGLPESVRAALRTGWGIVFVGLIVFALWRISTDVFARLRRKLASMAGAEVEPLSGAFKADFLNWLKRILLKLLGVRISFRIGQKSKSLLPEIASVREIYRRFLQWAAAGGYPRRSSQTPYEYLHAMSTLIPESKEQLSFITQQYVDVRYGFSLPTENDLAQLRQSWNEVAQKRLKRQSTG